eukprot:jgi/Ulvmu1/5796/UM025_0051.1
MWAEAITLNALGKPPRFFSGWGRAPDPLDTPIFAIATQPGIAQHLGREFVRVYGDRITVERGVRLEGGEVCEGKLLLEGAAGSTQQRQFDLVVGADGVNSVVRRLMAEQDPDMVVELEREDIDQHNLIVPLTPLGAPGIFAFVNVRHRGEQNALVLSGTRSSFRAVHNRGNALAALCAARPYVPAEWLEEAADAIAAMHEGSAGIRPRQSAFVRCSKLGSGRAMLVGDAAHSMSLLLGMGFNSALQDTLVLSRAVAACGGVTAAVGSRYSAMHTPDAHALVRIGKSMEAPRRYKEHKSVARWMCGKANMATLFAGTMPVEDVERAARAYFRRCAAVLCCVTLGGMAAAAWLASQLRS